MSRFIAFAATLVLSLWSFASHAVTLEPLPGSTPQTTCFSCVFPNPIGVIARGASGEPLAGVAVTFTTQSLSLGMVRYDDFCCVAFQQVTVSTGADGVAVGTVITHHLPGSSGVVTASAVGAADVAFQLSSSTHRGTTVAVVSGNSQIAQTGTLFAEPWKVRVLDAAGQPVPNTMVSFYAGGFDGWYSSANFNGNDWAFAVADANGIASSPVARAGAIVGDRGLVEIALKAAMSGQAAPQVLMAFQVVPYALSGETLEPLPGSTPQTTCFSCVFPNPVGVIARDRYGAPLAGVPVTFTTQSDSLGMVHLFDFCCVAFDQTTVVTGADGVAVGTVITHHLPGQSGVVTASADGAAPVAFQLSSSTRRATTVAVVGGDEQYVQTGEFFRAPWKVRVLDAAGQPVPNTMVSFYVGGFDGSVSSAEFYGVGGDAWAFAVADANGIATSPPALGGAIVGDYGVVDAALKAPVDGEAAPSVLFLFHVVPYPIKISRATLVGEPPASLQLGTLAATPYALRLTENATGRPAVGMPVTFTSGFCGAFGNAQEQVVLTDDQGIARSALLTGDSVGVCDIRIRAAGVPDTVFTTSMHVFDPNAVVVTPRSPWVVVKKKQTYRVVVDFTESGLPIQPASLEAINVLRDRHLPPAGFVPPPTISIVNGSATLDLRANQVPGLYDLEIVFWGPSRARVHVIQTP